MQNIERTEISTGVLVVGGGLAGCLAGMAARRQGCGVLIAEKGGSISRSGAAATGIDHYRAFLGEGPEDTPEGFNRSLSVNRHSLIDARAAATFAREARPVFEYLERIGVPFKDRQTGKYVRVGGLGNKNPSSIHFEGGQIKHVFSQHLKQLGAGILERVAIQRLLRRGDRVVGAIGMHVRNGGLYVIRARAVIIATGGIARLYPTSSSGRPFVSFTPPFNTGDGHVMAFQAGAAITNMEFPFCSVAPTGFCSPGISGFVGYGARLINGAGERYLLRYHPANENAPRNLVVNATLKEYAEGRGPCYVDCTHLPPDVIGRIKAGILNEKPTILDFLASRGIDISRNPIPFEVREFDFQGSGLVIDDRCATTVEGLFSAGDCSSVGLGAAGACTFGYAAGFEAARFADGGNEPAVDLREVNRHFEDVWSPLENAGDIRWPSLQEELHRTMANCVGFARDQVKLAEALVTLKSLAREARNVVAKSYHELLRANEIRNLIEVGKMVAEAALLRTESRSVPSHYRSDYPRTDDGWRKFIVMTRGDNGEIKVSYNSV